MQGLAEGNTTLANRTAAEAKETREKAELNAAQAEAQVAYYTSLAPFAIFLAVDLSSMMIQAPIWGYVVYSTQKEWCPELSIIIFSSYELPVIS